MEVEWRNPMYANHEHTQIDLEVNHPVYGWIPFTLDPDDIHAPFDAGELFDEVIRSETPIAEYDGPVEPSGWLGRVRQFFGRA